MLNNSFEFLDCQRIISKILIARSQNIPLSITDEEGNDCERNILDSLACQFKIQWPRKIKMEITKIPPK